MHRRRFESFYRGLSIALSVAMVSGNAGMITYAATPTESGTTITTGDVTDKDNQEDTEDKDNQEDTEENRICFVADSLLKYVIAYE